MHSFHDYSKNIIFLLKLLTSWGDGSVKLFNSRLNTALLKRKIHAKHVFKISQGRWGFGGLGGGLVVRTCLNSLSRAPVTHWAPGSWKYPPPARIFGQIFGHKRQVIVPVLLELMVSSFLDLISKQARRNAAVSVFFL